MTATDSNADDRGVRIWRPFDTLDVLALSGRTREYSFEPLGQWVIGSVSGSPMAARRRQSQTLVCPGQLCLWDPDGAHHGRGVDRQPWQSQLIIIGSGALEAVLGSPARPRTRFRGPVVDDPTLWRRFALLSALLNEPADRLSLDIVLAETLASLLATTERGTSSDRSHARDARDVLEDRVDDDVSLTDLADALGIDKFRLIRCFKLEFGVPPHRYRMARRLERAQRLLESGAAPATVAVLCGFYDQSHMHRNFVRHLGFTPGRYAAAFAGP